MINWAKTNIAYSVERKASAAEMPNVFAGCALADVLEGGFGKVKRAGSSGDRMSGVCMYPLRGITTNTRIDQIVVPASSPYVVVLPRLATSTIGASRNDTGALVTVSSSAASSTNIQSGTDSASGNSSLTFDSSFAGVTFNVAYSYTMSSVEALSLIGTPNPGQSVTDQLGWCGVAKIGRIATSAFDPLANWYTGANFPGVKVLSGGVFSSTDVSGGITPTGVEIVEVPTAASPWLVLDINM